MVSKKELYAKAVQQIGERRQAAMNKAKAHEAEAAINIPGLSDIKARIAATGIRLAELFINKSPDGQAKLLSLAEENLALNQKIKDLLVSNGYPEDYLKVKYTCPVCEDTGIHETRRCSCVNRLVRELSARQLAESSSLRLCDFSAFNLSYYPNQTSSNGISPREQMTRVYDYCRDYASSFSLSSPSLFFHGNTGLGKTHLSLAIANCAVQKGFNVVYGSAVDFLRKISNEYFSRESSSGDTMEILMNADLLVFDDLGAEFDSNFNVSAVYDLINRRISLSLPTIISSNLTVDELERKYSSRIVSRLMSDYSYLWFDGKDIRQIRAMQNRE